MAKDGISTLNVIFHDLDEALASQLSDAVSQPGRAFHSTTSTSECISVAEQRHADVVFCTSDHREYQSLLRALKQSGLKLPVVVVSRIPETSEWLEALDAGATDYCAAPFERQHISWLVQSALLAVQRLPMMAPSH